MIPFDRATSSPHPVTAVATTAPVPVTPVQHPVAAEGSRIPVR
jgi:hypothetical protein